MLTVFWLKSNGSKCWWEVLNMCLTAHSLSRDLYRAKRYSRAITWCEIAYLTIIDTSNTVQSAVFALKIVTSALQNCFLLDPPNHKSFLTWFGRLLELKNSLKSFEVNNKRSSVVKAFAYAYMYVHVHVQSKGSILAGMLHHLVQLIKEQIYCLFDRICGNFPLTIRDVLHFGLLITCQENSYEHLEKLMKAIYTSLERTPKKKEQYLSYLYQYINTMHMDYFSQSTYLRCFSVVLLSYSWSELLKDPSLQCLFQQERGEEDLGRQTADMKSGKLREDFFVPRFSQKVIDQFLEVILPRAVINSS